MGKASARKRERRLARLADASKLKIVVCAYPSRSLEPVTELLKAALRDQPGTAGSDARDLLSFAHGVGAAGEEDAEPVVIEVAEPST